MLGAAAALVLLTTGCGLGVVLREDVTTTYAVYQHPLNGDFMECEVLHSGGIFNNVPDLGSGGPYADCKTALEERGYVRVGTAHHRRQARTPAEAAIPRGR